MFSIKCMDAVGFLKEFASGSVDLIITDPPYESMEKHRAVGTTTRLKKSKSSSNEWFDIFHNKRFEELFAELYRVLKKDSHLYLFCDQETMFVVKGKRKLQSLSVPDVLVHPRVRGGYPTEKPVGLIKTLVAQSSAKGDLVVDPFCGSGSTGVAAIEEGRLFAGCDLAEGACDLATRRIMDAGDPWMDEPFTPEELHVINNPGELVPWD